MLKHKNLLVTLMSILIAIFIGKSFKQYFFVGTESIYNFRGIDVLPLFSFFCISVIAIRAILSYIFFNLIHRTDNKLNLIFIVIVSLILIAPSTKINKADIDHKENRKLTIFPRFMIDKHINYDFNREFESWLNDRYRGRDEFIGIYSRLNSIISREKENSQAFEGKEGWLFYKGEHSVGNFQNASLFTEQQLLMVANNLENLQEHLAKNGGGKLYVLILPDKNRVYGEYYPDSIKKMAQKGRGEQTYQFLYNKGTIDVIYPLNELLAEKKKNLLYYKNDTHWNPLGAFIAYRQLITVIKKDFSEIHALSLDDFETVIQPHLRGDLSDMLDMSGDSYSKPTYLEFKLKSKPSFSYIKNDDYKGVVTKSNRNLPKTLVFRDSFFNNMIPYTSETLGDSEYIYISSCSFDEKLKKIEEYKPQILIFEVVERSLPILLTQSINEGAVR